MAATPGRRPNLGLSSSPVRASSSISIGDTVVLPGGHKGTLKYLGGIHGKAGGYAGVEMLPGFEEHGRHNGEFQGIKYFETAAPNTGVFIAVSKISPIASSLSETPKSSSMGSLRRRSSLRTPTTLRLNNNNINLQPVSSQTSPKKQAPGYSPVHGVSPAKATSAQKARIASPRRLTQVTSTTPNSPGPTMDSAYINTPNLSPRKARVSGFHQHLQPAPRLASNGSFSGSLNGSSNSVSHVQLASVTQELESTKAALADKDKRLKEQFALIQEMEVSLNEVQQIVLSHENSSDVQTNDIIANLRKELQEKDDKIALMKQEFELKRQDFRISMESLQHAIDQRGYDYEERIKELEKIASTTNTTTETSTTTKNLQNKIDQLQNELNMMKQTEADTRAQLSRLADAENKLLDREEELKETKESLKHYQDIVNSGSGSNPPESSTQNDTLIAQLQEQLEYEKSRSASLEVKLGEYNLSHEEQYSQLQDKIRTLELEKQEIKDQLASERTERKKLKKECENLEAMLESRIMKETEIETELETLKLKSRSVSGSTANSVGSQPTTPITETFVDQRQHRDDVLREDVLPAQNVDDNIPVYKSPTKTDPAAGRQLWCGLCEREGHESLDCPYEEEF